LKRGGEREREREEREREREGKRNINNMARRREGGREDKLALKEKTWEQRKENDKLNGMKEKIPRKERES
jgi:hypothetical protein